MIKILFISLLCGVVAAFFFLVYLSALYKRDQEEDYIKKKKELHRQERVEKLKGMLDRIEHPENYPDEQQEEGEEGEEGDGAKEEESLSKAS